MFNKKLVGVLVILGLFLAANSFAASVDDDWNDLIHFTKIGRLDLAKEYAQALLNSSPDPVKLLSLSQDNPQGYAFLLKVSASASDADLKQQVDKVLDLIEQGRYTERTNPKIIAEEIRKLSTTDRARLKAVENLKNAGEYAIPYMLDAMADDSRKAELPNIIWALPQIGRDAVRPLTSALLTDNVGVKFEIARALGKIGYPQSLPYLKYLVEKGPSQEIKNAAQESIKLIDPAAIQVPACQLFYKLAEDYYYQKDSLKPAEDANFANIWFWNRDSHSLTREKVDKKYFYELMSMRSCEWSLKSDPNFGDSIGLWIAGFFKAESTGVKMPNYFGTGHPDAMTFAATTGPQYLHQALARAIKDKNAYVALGVIEALAATAGESSLLYRVGIAQPLVDALSFNDRAVKYSAAIAIAAAGPGKDFPESKLIIENLTEALAEKQPQDPNWTKTIADSYAFRTAEVMLTLAQTRNSVVKLNNAQDALIEATKDTRDKMKVLAAQILAYLNTSPAQQAVAQMALDDRNSMEIRIDAFKSLSVSAKINASLLDDTQIDAIYAIISSTEANPELRAAAASAYGSLNLPSAKVKDLILDQAKELIVAGSEPNR